MNKQDKHPMTIRRGLGFDVFFCSDLILFLDTLDADLELTNTRKASMMQEVQDSFDTHGICGYLNVPKRIYYVCIDHERAKPQAYEDMCEKLLSVYPPLLSHSKPVPRYLSDAEIDHLKQPHRQFLKSVGLQLFDTQPY